MKILSKNRYAFSDYEIHDKYIAGIVLEGVEVKSIKAGLVKIEGAYIFVNMRSAIVRNMHVTLWPHANLTSKSGYEPARDRNLLLTKKELEQIVAKRQQQRLQIVPLSIGVEKNRIKIEFALARGLKKYDKKNRKKEREEKLKIQRIAKTVEIVR